MATLRLFIAVDTPADIKSRIVGLQQQLKQANARVSWEPPGKLHTTIKFLGDTEEQMVTGIVGTLEEIGSHAPPLSVRYRGLGCFPTTHDPKVVWVGIDDVGENLARLQRQIEDGLEQHGFEPERRPFRPHLTLGRVRERTQIESLLTKMETVTFESTLATLHEIILVKSVLKPAGSMYTILKSIPLNG